MYMHVYRYMYVYMYMYMWKYMHMHTCICVHMYMCIYAWAGILPPELLNSEEGLYFFSAMWKEIEDFWDEVVCTFAYVCTC